MSQRAFSHGVRLVLTSLLALASLPAIPALAQPAAQPSRPSPVALDVPRLGLTRADAAALLRRAPSAEAGPIAIVPLGVGSEGDGIDHIAFSSDGTKVLVTHYLTDNVVVFDAATHEVLSAIEVGRYPIDVVASDAFALVLCLGSDEAWIVDLTTFEATAVPTHGLPVRAALSPDGRVGYVGTALAGDSFLEAFDLQTGARLWANEAFDVGLLGWSEPTSYTGRVQRLYQWTPLVVLPDGRIVTSGYDEQLGRWNHLAVFAPGDGAVSTAPAEGYMKAARLSGDGTKLVFAEGAPTGDNAVRLDAATLAVETRLPVPDLMSFSRYDLAVDGTGALPDCVSAMSSG